MVTVPEVKNRIHAFYLEDDALAHAKQFNGRQIENPFGRAFVLPAVARMEQLTIGVPALPDAIPLKVAVFKPIFKENRLDVQLVPIEADDHAASLFRDSTIEGFVCDLPTALVFAHGRHSVRIVKNILRPNPYRSLFAMVAQPDADIRDFEGIADLKIVVPKGVSFQFYAHYFLNTLGVPLSEASITIVENTAAAWDLIQARKVSAAVLRAPYTDMAMAKNMRFWADDRTLPWMSVLVLKQSVIENKSEAIKRFMLGLEQSVLALNLKPDDYGTVLEQQGGIPPCAQKIFPMPIFEGANGPSSEEIQPILQWLVDNGYLDKPNGYQQLVSLHYLPDPENVGLAYCCR
jgi:ABC-type nitrate/sulfonate/bicarbonate transport system substrate-binding protein